MANQNLAPLATDYAGVREYIGARYVPVFANPPEWSDTREYEPLTIVLHQGNSYTSAQYVPTGIDISNTEFWMLTGEYNAQVEAYRKEVLAFDGRITENAEGVEENKTNITDLTERVENLETYEDSKNTMVVIGDSFSAGNQTQQPFWHEIVGKQLGLTVENRAVSGAGYQVGETFIAQLNSIQTPAENIAKIYVFGGLNDTRQSGWDRVSFRADVETFMTRAKSLYPDAKIEVYGPNSFANVNVNEKQAARMLSDVCSGKGIEYHNTEFTWNWMGGFFNNTQHPSVIGSAIIAATILNHGQISGTLYNAASQPAEAQLCSFQTTDGETTITPTFSCSKVGESNIFVVNFALNASQISQFINKQCQLNIPNSPNLIPDTLSSPLFLNAYLQQAGEVCMGWADALGHVRFQILGDRWSPTTPAYGQVTFMTL